MRIGLASQPNFSASPPMTPNATRLVRERQRRGAGASALENREGAGFTIAGQRYTSPAVNARSCDLVLPDVWHEAPSYALLIVRVTRKLGGEHALLIDQTPDEHRHHQDDGDESPPGAESERGA